MRVLTLLALTLSLQAQAQSWSIEVFIGDAYNFRTELEIEQDGFSRSLDADYETRGFETPLYYVLRGARWRDQRAWELSIIHHKLYLQNPPPNVESLSISHGFNIISLNRAWRSGPWVYRVGVGPVITHAETTINGVRYEGPYRLSRAALLAGGGWRLALGRSAFLALELMATAAYASPELEGTPGARIRATNVALHGLAGLGYEFR